MGATATGKTELAVSIAKRFPVEIISVDSALIYRGMNIGTAKPDADVLAQAPHFLIDIIEPEQQYSVWKFVSDATILIRQIMQRGNIPLLVGGTMMYFHALENGLNNLPKADEIIRARLNTEADKVGWGTMHDKLAIIDPASAKKIEPGDSQRIQRALEVFEISGQPLSELQRKPTQKFAWNAFKLILNALDRAQLHSRIAWRFNQMLEQGIIAEVESLRYRSKLNLSLPSMRCVGYRQVWHYLDGTIDREEMIQKAIVATRQLAKRQITWLRKQPQSHAFDCLDYRKDAIFALLDEAFPGT
ncbi:MAG: tRNA (adenosine(37)-N6)-dimethylallyltransferase MiaA [Gammaproteobacteria bacterium]|nr:MAG: tRNA (adenosine(37)-N6)-dimethylallyltransferase MiaA [Gammaproteobacteria bacterium]